MQHLNQISIRKIQCFKNLRTADGRVKFPDGGQAAAMAGGSHFLWIPLVLSVLFKASDNRHGEDLHLDSEQQLDKLHSVGRLWCSFFFSPSRGGHYNQSYRKSGGGPHPFKVPSESTKLRLMKWDEPIRVIVWEVVILIFYPCFPQITLLEGIDPKNINVTVSRENFFCDLLFLVKILKVFFSPFPFIFISSKVHYVFFVLFQSITLKTCTGEWLFTST